MSLLATEAIVLHSFDYLESSRILRLLTREGGVRSVLARGARRSARRFGSGLDLFAQGAAQLQSRVGRDLDTLAAFDVARLRPSLAEDLGRFLGAAALAELVLRFGREAPDRELFDAVVTALDSLGASPPGGARAAALAGAWRLVATLGFAPAVADCAECHESLPDELPALFSHAAGGALCGRCGRRAPAGRLLPPLARRTLRDLLHADAPPELDESAARAHQRLLREFVTEHLTDGRPLRAFAVWEDQQW